MDLLCYYPSLSISGTLPLGIKLQLHISYKQKKKKKKAF